MLKKIMISLLAVVLLAGMLPAQTLAQEPVQCENVYTVQAGDWLSKIAEKYYGDALAFDRIVEASNAQSNDDYSDIANPDLIEPGLVLCLPSGDVMAQLLQMAQSAPPGLSPQDLANATYPTQYLPAGSVTLENGRFSEPVAPGSATEIKVNVTRHLAYGELNSQPAAAIVLLSDPGGSGSFYDLHVMVSQNGQPASVAATMLGDRVQINSMAIENNQIVVDMVQAGPDDPMCCPSQQVIKTFEVQGDQLVEVSSQMVEDTSSPQLAGMIWRWQQTAMNNDDTFVPADPANYTIEFMSDGTVAVQADCNRVSGGYTLDGSQITITLGPSTMAFCPEGSLGDQFVKNLGEANSFFFDGDDLMISLMFDSGSMRFSPAPSGSAETTPNLVDTVWLWQQTLMSNDDKFVPDNPGNYTVQFKADGTVAVKADCNQVGGTYTLDGSQITIELGPSTMAACPEGSLGDQFVKNLGEANSFFFDGDNLMISLMFDSGTMRFSPQSNNLAGTSWVVVGHNNGRGGVVSSIIDTEMTADFGADGILTGSAGCNTYQTGYEVGEDNAITIGPAISTMMACGEPEGIMEQEQEYLTALGTAATYQINGDILNLRTAEDSTAVNFVPAK